MLQHGGGAHCCSNLAVELSAPVHGDADVGQHTIVELLEFANINVNAPFSGQATRQLDASQDEAAGPFRKRAHDTANAGLDDETALDAGPPLDFEGQRRDAIVFLRHSKLLRGADTARMTLGRGLAADEMRGLKPARSPS